MNFILAVRRRLVAEAVEALVDVRDRRVVGELGFGLDRGDCCDGCMDSGAGKGTGVGTLALEEAMMAGGGSEALEERACAGYGASEVATHAAAPLTSPLLGGGRRGARQSKRQAKRTATAVPWQLLAG